MTTHFAAEVCTFSGALKSVSSVDAATSHFMPERYFVGGRVFDLLVECDIIIDLENVCFIVVKRYISEWLLSGGVFG